jgi:Trk K+ transport system NAD-binding subunit
MERLWAQDCERIPVLSDRDGCKIMGTVSKRDILGVYTLEVLQRRSMMTKFQAGGGRDESTYVELPADHRVDGVMVGPALAGQALSEARLRERFGVTVLMVRRRGRGGDEIRLVPEPDTRLEAGDRLVVFGPDEGVARLRSL